MTNTQALELLKDEFGKFDTMVFCEVYARFCELICSEMGDTELYLDKSYDTEFFKKQKMILEKQLKKHGERSHKV